MILWPNKHITWSAAPAPQTIAGKLSPSQVNDEVAAAFRAWSRALSFQHRHLPQLGPAITVSHIAHIALGWDWDQAPARTEKPHAFGLAQYPNGSAQRRIWLNPSTKWGRNWWQIMVLGCNDVQSIVMHEIGHALGLRHNLTRFESIMDQYSGQQFREIPARDIAHLVSLYNHKPR